jgi:transposase
VEPVDEVVAVVPEVCRHCGQPFPESAGRLWHWFRAGEFDRKALQRRLIPLQARLGRLLRHGQENADRKAAGLCRELTKWWRALWTFARVEGVEPTNNGAEWALRPAVLWRKGSFGSDSEAGSRLAERLLTVVATCRQQGRHLLDFLVAAGQAALEGAAPPSLLSAQQGAERLRLTYRMERINHGFVA